MKILHTADWHIGQMFYEYDRSYEHGQFLNYLVDTLLEEQIEVLLISGDIFDISNPSAASIKLFYSFLNKATQAIGNLQIVIIAGNHDSASRLEAPKPLLESSNVHIIGLVEKDQEGNINYEKLLIPLYDKEKELKVWCLAIPFLRMGDYPNLPNSNNPYTEGVAALYKEAFEYANAKRQAGQSIIAMGHLHAHQAEVSDLDKTERLIMGGVEGIALSAFDKELKYIALGHIHKAQKLGGMEHIRYAGSPLPMSFSELHYKHQLIVLELEQEISQLYTIEIPSWVALQRIPQSPLDLDEVLRLLEGLAEGDSKTNHYPYLEVRVLLDGPQPALRHKIESALEGKAVRLAKIDVSYPSSNAHTTEYIAPEKLKELQPQDVFSKVYQSKYQTEVPQELLQLFQEVAAEVNQAEN